MSENKQQNRPRRRDIDDLLAAARGEKPCDLVIKNGRVANVLSLEYEDADVAVHKGVIVGVGKNYLAKEIVDASGRVLAPGFIDAHLHIESTMLAPSMFARAVLPLGTTTVFPDPHEIANVLGLRGIEYMRRDASRTPLEMFFGAPPCVPASPFETPFEEIGAEELKKCFGPGGCTHMGEMMNFPGVINGSPDAWDKIAAAETLVRTAHLPGVSGKNLCAYLLSGCDGDHESSGADEALEKLRRGVWVMMRQGATENNLKDVIKIILDDESRYASCMAVSDDLTAGYILRNGHMDWHLRSMINAGVRPLVAAAMATINPARYFGLRDRGAIAPGKIADIVLVDSLESCRVLKVWKRGVLVAEEGRALFDVSTPEIISSGAKNKISFDEKSLKISPRGGRKIRVMEVKPGSVLTGQSVETPAIRGGFVCADAERDIAKIAVMEKNRGSGRVAVGFVRGFGLKRGAFASSVAHDAHNFIAVGMDDASMATAFGYLIENGGGLVVAEGGEIAASFALRIAGLMSDLPPESVAAALEAAENAAASLGAAIPHPFMALSFLSLSVIPELKLTDRGYVDISSGGAKDLFV
jgi:adenine deaminase